MKTLPTGDRRLSLNDLAKRYGMGHRTASKWLDSGTGPGRRMPGSKLFLILESQCDAWDRENPATLAALLRSAEKPTPTPRPTTEYLRRVG